MSAPFSRVTFQPVLALPVTLFLIYVFHFTLGDRSSTALKYFLIASTIATLTACLVHFGSKALKIDG
jgi:hypothetical protein